MEKYDVLRPTYVLEAELFRKNIERIAKIQKDSGVHFLMALKAFSVWKAFDLIKPFFDQCTASGPWEARLGHEEMGGLSHTFSAAYSASDFNEVLEHSSHVVFNSLDQLERFHQQCIDYSHPISIGLRVNPECSTIETDLYNPCAPGSRLGVAKELLPTVLPEYVEGLHFHALCESNSYDLEKTLSSFESLFGDYLPQLKWVNFGGGHLVTHKDYDVDHLIKLLHAFKEKWGVEVYMEPGSAFAWETGVLVAIVLDVVDQRGIKTAILDVSFTAHMPDCLEMPYQPNVRDAKKQEYDGGIKYRIGGNSCLAGDYLGDWWFDKALAVGDQIVFEDMIHYTMVKTTFFNGVKHPDIALKNEDGSISLLKHFTYDDYKNRIS